MPEKEPSPTADDAVGPDDLASGSHSEARIAHLFRATRRLGRIHPLQHLVQRYRAAQAGVDEAPP